MGSKSKAPPPPDYTGAALAQAQASKENLNIQNFANRPTINTPWGSETWSTNATTDPATGQQVTAWTQNTTLNPSLQRALDSQIGIQQGRSNLANAFLGRVGEEYSQPFDWQGLPSLTSAGTPGQLQNNLADYTPGLQTDVNSQNVVSGFGFGGPQMGVDSMTGQLTRGVSPTGVNTGFNSMTGNLASGTGVESLQRGLSTGDNPNLPQVDTGYRDRVAQSLIERMQPQQDYARQQLETQLSNQGFQVGSEGYQRALDDLAGRQAAERYNAFDVAGNEAQRLYNMQMGSRQQAFNEDVTGGQFYNQAANQAFQQGLAANQFQNQATNQAFQQDMAARQAQNQALGQQFNQQLAAGQFGNSATQQAYAQSLGAAQFGNQAQQQLYSQLMGQANLANDAGQQRFNQDLAAAQFGNQALGQAQALDIARMQAMNQAQQAQYGQNMQYANMMNQLRQQAIAEQQQRRGMSLNEMNALLTGQQVGMPQMPRFNASGVAETPQLLNAANMGYQAQMDQYNAQQAGASNLMGGLFSLGSAAISNPFMFSDRRLKRNIKRVGTHSTGVGLYEYDVAGYRQRGVIAQELKAVRPDLVRRHASGYLTVNYGAL